VHCQRHLFEPAIDVCGGCRETYCADCLVWPFGRAKLPYCLTCAVQASGVRQRSSKLPRLTRRDLKELETRRSLLTS
jgi:hypothetical protein